MLATLAAFESVGSVIDAGWDRQLSGSLSGPDGLSLVVEVAHDLRSPLTSILFLAETLQRGQSGDVNELQHRQLGLIYSAALGLSTVASNVIELARGGERLADDQPAPFSVTDILESVHDIVHPMAEEKGLTVRLLPPASDHRLGYPHALSRVLLNLTTNALKFTEEGFVEIVAREVDLTRLEFSVRDSGPGISGQALETLYLPFRPSGDRYAFSGTGLGLELSRRLVEAMGSELLVETKPRWGTRFYFCLGLKPV
jgi:signal transduction histidine kinase